MIAALKNGTAEFWATLVVLLCAGLLAGALFFEFVLGLPPCPLCMMQRIWFVLAGGLAYVSLLHNPRWGIYPLLTVIAAGVGGYFAGKHLWLQSLPAEEVPACGPDLAYMIEVFPMADLLTAMTTATGDCADVSWSFLGITLPGWALLGFIAVAACAFAQLRRGLR